MAYLVDALPVALDYGRLLAEVLDVRDHQPPGQSTQLINFAVKTESSTMLKDSVHVFDPTSDQSFILNVPLFRAYHTDIRDSQSCLPLFIELTSPPTSLTHTPIDVIRVLDDLFSKLSLRSCNRRNSIVLAHGIPSNTMIPLAATLLEYPIAYVPSSAPQESRIQLKVYHLFATFEENSESISVIKFSCPVLEGGDVDTLRLERRCVERGARSAKVEESIEVVDRLVL